MSLFRWTWDPLDELRQLRREVADAFGRRGALFGGRDSRPPVNAYQDAEGLTVTAEVPGVRTEDISVETEGAVLRISGERAAPEGVKDEQYHRRERRYGEFLRELRLPGGLDTTKIEAKVSDGVLTVHLAKAEDAKPRKIKVKAGG
jgi:HSP20 family protein